MVAVLFSIEEDPHGEFPAGTPCSVAEARSIDTLKRKLFAKISVIYSGGPGVRKALLD